MTAKQPYIPERGDIVWNSFDPGVGHEQSGWRPALVLSDHQFSQSTGLAVVCPITTKPRGLSYELPLRDTKTRGAVLMIYVRSIDFRARHTRFIEHATPDIVEDATTGVRAIIDAA